MASLANLATLASFRTAALGLH